MAAGVGEAVGEVVEEAVAQAGESILEEAADGNPLTPEGQEAFEQALEYTPFGGVAQEALNLQASGPGDDAQTSSLPDDDAQTSSLPDDDATASSLGDDASNDSFDSDYF